MGGRRWQEGEEKSHSWFLLVSVAVAASATTSGIAAVGVMMVVTATETLALGTEHRSKGTG